MSFESRALHGFNAFIEKIIKSKNWTILKLRKNSIKNTRAWDLSMSVSYHVKNFLKSNHSSVIKLEKISNWKNHTQGDLGHMFYIISML